MAYSEKVIDHYEHPRNVGSLDKDSQNVGTGLVGAPACGDVMKLQIEVDADGIATIRMTDSGPGLPDKAKKNLFVPYAGGGERGGTGLGLAIVAELMIAHGGRAELEKSDTDGATFRLTLPGPAPE